MSLLQQGISFQLSSVIAEVTDNRRILFISKSKKVFHADLLLELGGGDSFQGEKK